MARKKSKSDQAKVALQRLVEDEQVQKQLRTAALRLRDAWTRASGPPAPKRRVRVVAIAAAAIGAAALAAKKKAGGGGDEVAVEPATPPVAVQVQPPAPVTPVPAA